MGAMAEFLERLDGDAIKAVYRNLDAVWDERARSLNERMSAADLPVRVANLSSVWTIRYVKPSRYNWMFQYYLRSAGLALSWVGTGRLIFSLNYSDSDFAQVADLMVSAARAMQADGWWWADPALTNQSIKRRVLREMIHARSFSPLGSMSSPRSK
jgi:glutamate-1-semialdehyde 2,1-aminomutase